MKGRVILKWVIGFLAIGLFIQLIVWVVIQPWVRNKVEITLNNNNSGYIFEIDKVKISIWPTSIMVKSIEIYSKLENEISPHSVGVVSSVNLKGINVFRALFKKDIKIKEIIISNSDIRDNIQFSQNEKPPVISDLNIQIGELFFENTNLEITDVATARSFYLELGNLKVYGFNIFKSDTLSQILFNHFIFNAKEISLNSADSLYSYTIQEVGYSTYSNLLEISMLSVVPNYSDYEFTNRFEYETDRFDAVLSNIRVTDFSAPIYMKSGSIISTNIEIGSFNLQAFRDKRKKFPHVNRPSFQELFYSYPAYLRIESIAILDGKITYIEHAEDASAAGFITFSSFKAAIQNITNDTIYKTDTAFIELQTKALLMGKGKLSARLKSKLFDPQNTFTLEGSLTSMQIDALNPMLENNAFVYVTSGTIDAMDFSFLANNTKASGEITMLYHDLNFKVVNKKTNETTAVIERVKSFIAGLIVMDSNPISGKNVRQGVIDYERDPEKFLFNYSFKAIFSGMKHTLVKK